MSKVGLLFSDKETNVSMIVGSSGFIKYLIETLKVALDEGIVVETFVEPTKTEYTVIVKIEENEEKIPQGDEELRKYAKELMCLYANYAKIYTNLSELLLYAFFKKCRSQAKTKNIDIDYEVCIEQYNRFRKLLSSLLFDKNGYIRFPTLEECKNFLHKLLQTEIDDEFLQKCLFGKEEDIQKCVDKYFSFDKIKLNRSQQNLV